MRDAAAAAAPIDSAACAAAATGTIMTPSDAGPAETGGGPDSSGPFAPDSGARGDAGRLGGVGTGPTLSDDASTMAPDRFVADAHAADAAGLVDSVRTAPSAVDLGQIDSGVQRVFYVAVSSSGTTDCALGGIASNPPTSAIQALLSSFSVPPGQAGLIPILFAPSADGAEQATSEFQSLDQPGQPIFAVDLRASAGALDLLPLPSSIDLGAVRLGCSAMRTFELFTSRAGFSADVTGVTSDHPAVTTQASLPEMIDGTDQSTPITVTARPMQLGSTLAMVSIAGFGPRVVRIEYDALCGP